VKNFVFEAPWLASPVAYGVHVGRGGYQAHPHVRLISDAFARCARTPGGRLMIISPPRHGKPLADSTPVMTTAGWKTHGELEPGDYVFAPDGNPVEVREVHPLLIGERAYAITFSDGETIVAGQHHEWPIYYDCESARCGIKRKGGKGARHRHYTLR
jgi:hypothetical protein